MNLAAFDVAVDRVNAMSTAELAGEVDARADEYTKDVVARMVRYLVVEMMNALVSDA